MTYTYTNNPYSSSNLTGSTTDVIRLNIGDTLVSTDPLLTDEEIKFYLDQSSNLYYVSYMAALAISGKFSRLADKTIGETSIKHNQKSKQYADLAASLKSKALTSTITPTPYCYTATDDAPDRAFTRNMMDYPGLNTSSEDWDSLTPL